MRECVYARSQAPRYQSVVLSRVLTRRCSTHGSVRSRDDEGDDNDDDNDGDIMMMMVMMTVPVPVLR